MNMAETPAPTPDELLSRVLAGRYRIERQLRRGGMGAVYVARDLKEDKDVAVKVVRQALLEDPQALARFKREARLVTELSHENIVRSFDAGDDAGLLWIAMELLDGESLRERLDARGRLAWADTLPLVEQIAQALGAAHDRGIIHRDLKPENVMMVLRDDVTRTKLLDFGVAKQAHVEGQTSGTSNMTGTGLIVGTPGYVAPEVVLEGTTDDPRSDFYALGVVWFEMLTGQKPFTAKTAFALAMRHAHEPAPTPTSLVPYSPVPTPIERVVLRLLAKNPNDRPADARELLITLATLAEESQKSLSATPAPSLLSGSPNDATVTDFADIHRTGVVPFVGTPKPPTDPRPDMTGTGTPATAQFAPGMTPPGATPLPQLLGQIPKKVFAAMGAALVALIVVIVLAMTALTARLNAPNVASAPSVTVPVPQREKVSALPVAAQIAPSTPMLPAVAPPSPSPPAEAAEPFKKRRDKKSETKSETSETKNETKSSESVGTGKLIFNPKPKKLGWLIQIDGAVKGREPGEFELAAGPHMLRITTPAHPGKAITKVVDIKAGEPTRIIENLEAQLPQE